jgi:trimeric autotransporter adhesin
MRTIRFVPIMRAGALVLILGVLAVPVSAQLAKEGQSRLDDLAFARPELRVSRSLVDSESLPQRVWSREETSRFRSENGAAWRVLVDQRTGRPNLLEGGAIPFIPGPANKLQPQDFGARCDNPSCIPLAKVESLARDFLKRYQGTVRVNTEELVLDPVGSVPVGSSVLHVRFQWVYRGVPVEGGSVFFTINNGNLIQLGTQGIGDINLDPKPAVSREKAWQLVRAYVGGENEKDEILDRGSLAIIPITPKGLDPDSLKVPFGKMIDYVLVHKLSFRRPGVLGTWEALVNAHTGELIRFRDLNRYGHIQGGVYKTDKPAMETTMAFPFADYGVGVYADAIGDYPASSGTSTMTGRASGSPGGVDINDNCGAISLASSGMGLINLGTSAGTDCITPGVGGAGNTHAARTQYWNVSQVKMKGISYLPTNAWLQSRVTDNVNINQHCNAYWNGVSLNFFTSGDYTPPGSSTTYTCSNTGELPGVSLHEWGHGMDDNDGSGSDNRPVETRADWTAILQTHQSCAGGGFYTNISPMPSYGLNCGGHGNPCTACTGVRDADYADHTNPTAWTPQNKGTVWGTASCSGGSYFGPCGWEDHCESGLATQALWDFVNRDLVGAPTSLNLVTAWQLADRLFYAGMPSSSDMYTCTGAATKTSNGCGTGSLYSVMRTIDDDGDGTANGTPHAAAIFAALNRHGIACGAAADPTNQNQTSCPALTTPTLTATPTSHQVTLNWTSGGASATRYFVFRNETGCSAGFTLIHTVAAPTLTYTDTAVVHGTTYYYRVQAATANDSCVSAMSNCASVAVNLAADKDFYVSDWNTSSLVYDNGVEPSSGPNWGLLRGCVEPLRRQSRHTECEQLVPDRQHAGRRGRLGKQLRLRPRPPQHVGIGGLGNGALLRLSLRHR